MKILVVDDSIVFRSQISASLADVNGVEVVGSAPNGRIAISKIQQQNIDLITLDMEMPEMNGTETIIEMKKLGLKTKIIVFSSQTVAGAEKALEALRLGADDVVAKPSGEHSNFEIASAMIKEALVPRVEQFMRIHRPDIAQSTNITTSKPTITITHKQKVNLNNFFPKAIVIASSTGGPTALETIFENLKITPTLPIFIAQHMPPVFTQILAKRLSTLSGIDVQEASDKQKVIPGQVYIAPGGYHMLVKKNEEGLYIELNQEPLRNSVRPAADFLFESMSDIFKGNLVGIVLTGMGEDGADGAKYIKDNHGAVVIQNKESCVVFGMPGAVFENDDHDGIMDLEKLTTYIKRVAS